MSSVGIAELKAHLSEHLDRVRHGEEVVVTDHGRPVARIVPIARMTDGMLQRLTALGAIRLPAAGQPGTASTASTAAAGTPRVLDVRASLRAALDLDRDGS